jgi:hypothetical protein
MGLLLPAAYGIFSLGLHAVVGRIRPGGNRVAQFLAAGGIGGVALVIHLWASSGITPAAKWAGVIAYAFACELWIFLFTFVTSSVSVGLLLSKLATSPGRGPASPSLASADMVSQRLQNLTEAGLLRQHAEGFSLTSGAHRLVAIHRRLRHFFRHGSPEGDQSSGTPRQQFRVPRRLTGIGLGLLLAGPFLLAALSHYEGFALANESIAYRWGHSSRLAAGDVPPMLPQGFTILAVQQQLVRLIERSLPLSAENLRQSLQLFSWGTFAVFIALLAGTGVAAYRNRTLDAGRMILVFMPWIAAIYGAGSSGIYYSLLPDYYHLNAVLACVVAYLASRLIGSILEPDRPPSLVTIAVLGSALGLGVANKITWGVPCVFVLGLVLLAGRLSPGRILLRASVLIGSAVLTTGLILLACYHFSPSLLRHGLEQWTEFLRNQQGSVALWSPSFLNTVKRYNYDVLYSGALLTILAALIWAKDWRNRSLGAIGLLTFSALVWLATKRPADTTFWDINVLTILIAVITTLAMTRKFLRGCIILVWVGGIGFLLARNPPVSAIRMVTASHGASQNRFEVFSEVRRFAGDRHEAVLLLNNEFGHGGVHELLLKASADFPTWNTTVGATWLNRVFPDASFHHEYGPPVKLPERLAGTCIVWFDLPDLPPTETRFPQLALWLNDPANEAISLPVYVMNSDRRIQVWAWALKERGNDAPFRSSLAEGGPPRRDRSALSGPEILATKTPLDARRVQAGVLELTWPARVASGDLEIQLAAAETEFVTIGRGAAQPGRYVIGSIAPDVVYRVRARWSTGRQIHDWSDPVVVPPLP